MDDYITVEEAVAITGYVEEFFVSPMRQHRDLVWDFQNGDILISKKWAETYRLPDSGTIVNTWWTTSKAMQITGMTSRGLYAAAKSGRIRWVKVNRDRYFDPVEIAEYEKHTYYI